VVVVVVVLEMVLVMVMVLPCLSRRERIVKEGYRQHQLFLFKALIIAAIAVIQLILI
jgi:hypothetical protein